MKERMLMFILERLGLKIDDLHDAAMSEANTDLIEHIASDAGVYMSTLKELIMELINPM